MNIHRETSLEVRDALESNIPIVALDTTIFGQAGLGSEWPDSAIPNSFIGGPNENALLLAVNALREREVVPALTAVIDGVCKIGITESDYPQILNTDNKAGVEYLEGVQENQTTATTTISSALYLAHQVGIKVLSTSGIGGVHVDHSDRSSDLMALANYPVVSVAAGMKTFLDRQATLNALRELDVPVLGWRTQDCPAFYARSTGMLIDSVDTAEELRDFVEKRWKGKRLGGILLAVPIPEEYDFPLVELEPVIEEANADVEARGITGPKVTPEVLRYIRSRLGNELVISNIALARNNAIVAAEVAAAFTSLSL